MPNYSLYPVFCPNAGVSNNGVEAWPGNLIRWSCTNNGFTEIGRVLGRVEGYPYQLTGHLVVLALSDDLHHGHVRFVDPELVTTVTDIPVDFLSWFMSGEVPTPELTMLLQNYGSLSNRYIKDVGETAKRFQGRYEEAAPILGRVQCEADGTALRVPESSLWQLPETGGKVDGETKLSEGGFSSIVSYRALVVDSNGGIYGERNLSDLRQDGYALFGRVSIGGKKYPALTSTQLFVRPGGSLVSVDVIRVRLG